MTPGSPHVSVHVSTCILSRISSAGNIILSSPDTQIVYTFEKTLTNRISRGCAIRIWKSTPKPLLQGWEENVMVLKQSVDRYSWVYWWHSNQPAGLKTWANSSICVTKLWAGLLHGNCLANICICGFLWEFSKFFNAWWKKKNESLPAATQSPAFYMEMEKRRVIPYQWQWKCIWEWKRDWAWCSSAPVPLGAASKDLATGVLSMYLKLHEALLIYEIHFSHQYL